MKFLVIDNYDSFTYNLVHYIEMSGVETHTVFNDDPLLENFKDFIREYDAVVLSPGPCVPAQSGSLMNFIEGYHLKIPMLGVCLGMQALGEFFGWTLTHAQLPMHGKTSDITHSESGLFNNIKNPMTVGRYHSLILEPQTVSPLVATAFYNNEVMALEHKTLPVFGVQFHPESILTPDGISLIKNFIAIVKSLTVSAQ